MKKEKTSLQITGDYIAYHELNGLFGRIMTVLDAVIEYNSTDHKEGIKSLISNAVFCHPYNDVLLVEEENMPEVLKLAYASGKSLDKYGKETK